MIEEDSQAIGADSDEGEVFSPPGAIEFHLEESLPKDLAEVGEALVGRVYGLGQTEVPMAVTVETGDLAGELVVEAAEVVADLDVAGQPGRSSAYFRDEDELGVIESSEVANDLTVGTRDGGLMI